MGPGPQGSPHLQLELSNPPQGDLQAAPSIRREPYPPSSAPALLPSTCLSSLSPAPSFLLPLLLLATLPATLPYLLYTSCLPHPPRIPSTAAAGRLQLWQGLPAAAVRTITTACSRVRDHIGFRGELSQKEAPHAEKLRVPRVTCNLACSCTASASVAACTPATTSSPAVPSFFSFAASSASISNTRSGCKSPSGVSRTVLGYGGTARHTHTWISTGTRSRSPEKLPRFARDKNAFRFDDISANSV